MGMYLEHIDIVFYFSKKSPITTRTPKTDLFFKTQGKVFSRVGGGGGGQHFHAKQKHFINIIYSIHHVYIKSALETLFLGFQKDQNAKLYTLVSGNNHGWGQL